ncbi:MAG: 50S ribosomal protein L24 [Deltaproteobacteria bacterium GWA2_55_10]|uniref:Large ribosomal subunit protein uL24 n=1 Tax=uncultured delta proteobacterium Rifle_16ft_4_minimus_11275 TaxID=1665173 RepID=A0A0H4T057_9DELT|nr:50S ribosomal protein L24, large subunit ribosomal protein L24 [uncultured delta proteobacterium Rifle_16ft_4_minimus_11275]OGP17735.1 MAG: 50S ribosomal protein L24 [Deltaproteobacteria bacterium GWA2_55_10]
MALKIRKDDQIMVITGREKGKTGKVLRVDPDKEKVYVEKLNLVKRHQKPSPKYKHGGIIEKEAPLHVSNVMILCEKCKGPVRTGKRVEGDRRVRFCKKCGEVLDK